MAKKTVKPASRRASVKSRPKNTASPKKKATQARPATATTRRLKPAPAKRFGFRKVRHPVKLPNFWQITLRAAITLWQNKVLFLGIVLIYGLLNLVLIQGLTTSTGIGSIKSDLQHFESGHLGLFASGINVFAALVGSISNTASPTSGPYQLLLAVTTSLAVIWALRQVLTGAQVRIRDTYYRGMAPIIPFILVLLAICIQMLPFVVGAFLYNTVVTSSIALGFFEKAIFFLVFIALTLWSFYMVSSSIFALYIVTLPDMTPMKALRSARELVRHRRWTVLRKVICLPIVLLLIAAIIMLPIILILTPLAQWVFFLLSMSAIVAVHSYMYTLYRELLHE